MALHPTLSEVHFKKSVMKYLIDNLKIAKSVNLFFTDIFDVPTDESGEKLSSWVTVNFDDRKLETMASAYVMFTIFTRKDDEGFDSSRILDKISEVFTDEDSTNGVKSIPYYDTTVAADWAVIGGMLPIHRRTTGILPGKEGTQIRAVSYEFRWGAK